VDVQVPVDERGRAADERAEALELRRDLPSQLPTDPRRKEELHPGAGRAHGEAAIAADEARDLGRRQRRAALAEHEVKPELEPRPRARELDRLRGVRLARHEARRREEALVVRRRDGRVDPRRHAEIVGGEDYAFVMIHSTILTED
jgi:hypothetical protein